MTLRAVRDPVVMAEWQRRWTTYQTEYRAKTSWLRVPFYGATLACIAGAFALPESYLVYLAALEMSMLPTVGWYLSKYSYRAPACPHCNQPPFDLYRIRQTRDHCYRCGYWLADSPG